mmetsp:Transcript_13482/g.24398  ORF Transcript_13482/g.24398 Transcript_13482/m.24398 type:complete len:103 (-) Transcript_13482:123-431(-)
MIPNLHQPTRKKDCTNSECTWPPKPNGGCNAKANRFTESPNCTGTSKYLQHKLSTKYLVETELFIGVCHDEDGRSAGIGWELVLSTDANSGYSSERQIRGKT